METGQTGKGNRGRLACGGRRDGLVPGLVVDLGVGSVLPDRPRIHDDATS